MSRLLLVSMAMLLACGDDEHYLVVRVTSRPTVHDATTLRVTLANAGTMRSDELPLGGDEFPVTFSISAPGRSGELGVTIEAIDGANLLVGRGATTTTIEAATATVELDSADFVVNTDYPGAQFPAEYFDTYGAQVGATTDGRWTVVYRDTCDAGCNLFARQFDATGRAQSTAIGGGTNGFPISTQMTTNFTTTAVAAAGSTTLMAWNFTDPMNASSTGIACRSLDAQGRAINPAQVTVSADASTDLPFIAPLSNGNFAVTWKGLSTTVIRGIILRQDCTALAAPITISTTLGADRPSVAANGNTLLYAWQNTGTVYVRLASVTNQLQGAVDIQFLPPSTTDFVEYVRAAPLGAGFAVVVRWASSTGTGPGKIELYRTNSSGAVLGTPVPVTTKTGSDFNSSQAFGVATSSDGMQVFVTWHACDSFGDGQGCGVFGRAFRSDGEPASPELTVPTTLVGDQSGPSVAALPQGFAVAWRDDSMQAPDTSGAAVRARIIDPAAASGETP